MPWQSRYRFARISPSKVRPVINLIRGQDVQKALNLLKFSPQRAAPMISKTLASAVASANEQEADVESLRVVEARVDEGPRMKRIEPKDRGRAHPILKRFSHIVVVVDVEEAGA
jgi:large subunit ribosomal protein L22